MYSGRLGKSFAAFATASGVVLATVPASASAAPVVSTCGSGMVHLHHRDGGAGLGRAAWVLTVVNVSHTTCAVSGYLRVSELASRTSPLLQAKPTHRGYLGGVAASGPLPTVVLRPGASASAMLEGLESRKDGGACPATWGISVRLPVGNELVRMRFKVGLCDAVQIHPLVAAAGAATGSQR